MPTEQEYLDQLKASRPAGPTETLAEGMRPLDEGAQGLIEQQGARAAGFGDESAHRNEGVGADSGLLGRSAPAAEGTGFDEALNLRSKNAVAQDADRIESNERFMAPMRQGQMGAQASANYAKSESLRFNNWSLKNTQALQKLQLQQAKAAAEKSWLSSVLGLAGAGIGAGAGFLVGGPVGAAAGAGLGMGVAGGVGQAAG